MVPLHRELKRGTLTGILRDAGVDRHEFRRLLCELLAARLIDAAPLDDEPFTGTDAAAPAEADASGDACDLDDLRRELA